MDLLTIKQGTVTLEEEYSYSLAKISPRHYEIETNGFIHMWEAQAEI